MKRNKSKPNKLMRYKHLVTTTVVIIGLVSIFLSPADIIKSRLINSLPILAIGFAVTEGLFIAGLLIMASAVGYSLGKNPLTWHNELKNIAKHIGNSRLFWVGFWLNTSGAFGSGFVLAVGVIKVLPVASWVLLWIPILDIMLTLFVRSAILQASKPHKRR